MTPYFLGRTDERLKDDGEDVSHAPIFRKGVLELTGSVKASKL
jgi:hypothetical protein